MNLFRAAWSLWTVFWVTLFWSLVVIVAGLVGVSYRKGGVYDLAARKWGTWLAGLNGLRIRCDGLDRFPHDRPYVFISNHFSFADMWVLLAVLPDSVRFVAKKELFDVPIFGRALRAARHIRIDRKNLQAAFGAYEEAGEAIRDGISAIVFAEGTRSRNGKLQPFKKGPFVLAIASQVELVPVWIEGTFEALPSWQWWVKSGVATVRFGTPVPTKGMNYEAREGLMEQVRGQIVALAGDSPAVRVDPAAAWE
ncbi:MAG TPA: lysophospholipid acyltransferase family protein [Gemmatimonadales bacterium]|nr:lysophospholipid acyltransferase family protein [Gemmatimonadales bacterium]